jgi:predicted transcriptional regulator
MTVIVLDKELEQRLESQAARAHRQPSELAADAIRNYLEYEEWFVRAVEEGVRAADAGDLVDHEVVVHELEERLARAMDRTRATGS